jgi:hypothetical protein
MGAPQGRALRHQPAQRRDAQAGVVMRVSELKPQLARDIRATAKHFGLSPAAERQALASALQSVRKVARIYRAIAGSLPK